MQNCFRRSLIDKKTAIVSSQKLRQINVLLITVERSQCGKMKNLLSQKKISSNQLFSTFFSKTVNFTKFLPIECDSRIVKRESSITQSNHSSL